LGLVEGRAVCGDGYTAHWVDGKRRRTTTGSIVPAASQDPKDRRTEGGEGRVSGVIITHRWREGT